MGMGIKKMGMGIKRMGRGTGIRVRMGWKWG